MWIIFGSICNIYHGTPILCCTTTDLGIFWYCSSYFWSYICESTDWIFECRDSVVCPSLLTFLGVRLDPWNMMQGIQQLSLCCRLGRSPTVSTLATLFHNYSSMAVEPFTWRMVEWRMCYVIAIELCRCLKSWDHSIEFALSLKLIIIRQNPLQIIIDYKY